MSQSVHKQQQLQHQEFQRQMEEKLELLQRQQPFLSPDIALGLAQDGDYLEVVRARSESSDHSSPNVTPRASNHSNLSVSELGGSPYEREEGGAGSDDSQAGLADGFSYSNLAFIVFYHQRRSPVWSESATYRSVLKRCWVTVLREP